MSDSDLLKAAFRDEARTKAEVRAILRARRADATRREALNPARILSSVLLMPVVAAAITVSIYIRTSPFDREDALRDLVALAGCSAAAKIGLARSGRGEPGYHARNDLDGDGIACNENDPVLVGGFGGIAGPPPEAAARQATGAKFVRP